MLSILIGLLILPAAQAEAIPQQVVASCECVVLNDARTPILPPHSYVGAPVPVVPSEFGVYGTGQLSSEVERTHCAETAPGELNAACSIAVVKALHNATYLCGQIAQRYHPNQNDGFLNGSIEPSLCLLSIE